MTSDDDDDGGEFKLQLRGHVPKAFYHQLPAVGTLVV